ncbi:hypothetical protein [Ensifer sp.]|uniref:hypothetical protein n=1 Tax=Ensifer sp. TaxID=1872086 RepID=UPI0013AEB0E6|nr:hypothetical protein [Ensifer sp.]
MTQAEDEARRLRSMHISVPDIMRQTGLTMFEVYEVTENREMAVAKMARLHFVRGTGWPWDESVTHPDDQRQPTQDPVLDAARAIVDLFRGQTSDDPMRGLLDALPLERRKQVLEILVRLVGTAGTTAPPAG